MSHGIDSNNSISNATFSLVNSNGVELACAGAPPSSLKSVGRVGDGKLQSSVLIGNGTNSEKRESISRDYNDTSTQLGKDVEAAYRKISESGKLSVADPSFRGINFGRVLVAENGVYVASEKGDQVTIYGQIINGKYVDSQSPEFKAPDIRTGVRSGCKAPVYDHA